MATNDPDDKGVYNNWRPAAEMKPLLEERMRGASKRQNDVRGALSDGPAGIPARAVRRRCGAHRPPHGRAPHDPHGASGCRSTSTGLADPNSFVRAVHVTGDLANLGQGTADDQRYFVTVADERTILHFGSSYGGNALLGKIAHGLRQAAYDGWVSGEFLAEQFMLLGIADKLTGRRYHICGGFRAPRARRTSR